MVMVITYLHTFAIQVMHSAHNLLTDVQPPSQIPAVVLFAILPYSKCNLANLGQLSWFCVLPAPRASWSPH